MILNKHELTFWEGDNTRFEREEELRNTYKGVLRKKKLTKLPADIVLQKEECASQLQTLEKQANKEQLDVDKLEKVSLTAMFYQVLGRKDDKLLKEKAEAYAAAVKFDAAKSQYAALEADEKSYQAELTRLQDIESDYEKLRGEKLNRIQTNHTENSDKIIRTNEQINNIRKELKEIDEAIMAGNMVNDQITKVKDSLKSAEGYGTWDVVGGGMMADILKHSALDDAQKEVNILQQKLGRFKTEMTDVTINADIHVQIEGFERLVILNPTYFL